MDPIHRRILVELDAGAEPIAGRVLAELQPARSFTGWTGLFAALRTAVGEAAPSDARVAPGGDPRPIGDTKW